MPPSGFANRHLGLHLLPLIRINDRRVTLFHYVLRDLALVHLHLLGKEIHGELLLQDRAALVLLVRQDALNGAALPFDLPARRRDALSRQVLCDPVERLALNEKAVDVNGVVITKSAIMITCALVSGLITLLMAFYTNFPFALSTGMGSNFILGALIQSQALSFGAAMAITLISGIVFVLLTVFGLRDLIVRVIPKNIKSAISASIGFFIAYLGFKNCGIGSFENGIALGNLTDPAVLLAIGGLLLIIVLNALNVKGAILISIIATTLVGIPLGVTTLNGVAAMPDFGELGNVMFNLDFKGVFTASGLILVFVCFFGDFFSTLGTVLAVANRANMLDENGNLPGIERPFLVDAIGTCVGALTGNTTITTFVESTSGVEAGGRTGLTALVTGIMFLLTVFLAPLFVAIPYAATGPALIYVGFLMLKGFTEIDFTDFDDAIGPCVMMMFTAFTGNITNGLGAGIIVHVLVKLVRGKAKEIHPIMYLLCALMVLYFIVG